MMIFESFIAALVLVYPIWCIFRRAGFNPWLCLLVFIPLFGGVVTLGVLAFADWPAAPRARAANRLEPPTK